MATKEKKMVPPKLNKFMHPRNPYKTPPSFKKLATEYPEFRAHCAYDVSGKVHLDFKNPNALRALTTCLMRQDFGLEVNIPESRLVPTMPLRLNYLLWLEDLLSLAARRRGGADSPGATPVVGADVGTGAACVYPLLGAAHFGWCMVGSEADPLSYTSALDNVERNDLSGQVIVRKVSEKTILKGAIDHPETLARISTLRPRSGGGGGRVCPAKGRNGSQTQSWKDICPDKDKHGHEEEDKGKEEEEQEGDRNGSDKREEKMEDEQQEEDRNGGDKERREEEGNRDYIYDFTMTNPPFFSSEEETDTMAKSKKGRGQPNAAPTGCTQEKVTEGGEVEFIRQMVEESQLLRNTVRIFTTLIGTKAHIREVRRLVEAAKPTSSVFTEFCQGRTMRWGAAWTFAEGVSLAEVRSKKEMATNKPIILLLPRSLMSVYSVQAAWSKVQGWLKALKVKIEVFKSSKYFVSVNVKAYKPTWLHQRRRRREREYQHNGKSTKEEDEDKGQTSKRKPEEEAEERENKRRRTATDEEEETVNQETEEGEEEDLGEEEEEKGDQEIRPTDQDGQQGPQTGHWGDRARPTKGGLKCILRCNFQIKQTGGLISMEAYHLAGSLGKDGLNQLVQYMRNQLTNPPLLK